ASAFRAAADCGADRGTGCQDRGGAGAAAAGGRGGGGAGGAQHHTSARENTLRWLPWRCPARKTEKWLVGSMRQYRNWHPSSIFRSGHGLSLSREPIQKNFRAYVPSCSLLA